MLHCTSVKYLGTYVQSQICNTSDESTKLQNELFLIGIEGNIEEVSIIFLVARPDPPLSAQVAMVLAVTATRNPQYAQYAKYAKYITYPIYAQYAQYAQ